MGLELYVGVGSPTSQAVLVTAKHLGVDINTKEIDVLKGEQLSEEYSKINPCQKVPALVDGQFIVWESRAILRYLCNKYAPDSSLYPSDPQKRATIDQMLDYDITYFLAIHEILINTFRGLESTEQQMDNYHKNLKLMNTLIGDKKFIAGDGLTIADLSIAHTTSMMGYNDFKDTEDYSNLMTWYNGMKEESNHFKESVFISKEMIDKYKADKQKANKE